MNVRLPQLHDAQLEDCKEIDLLIAGALLTLTMRRGDMRPNVTVHVE